MVYRDPKPPQTSISADALEYALPDRHRTKHEHETITRRVADVLRPLDEKDRARVLRGLSDQIVVDKREELRKTRGDIAKFDLQIEVRKALIREFESYGNKPVRLERANGTRAHLLAEAMKNGRVIEYDPRRGDDDRVRVGYPPDGAVVGQPFVVEHDWAAAFKGAKDFDEGHDYKLPFDRCCFEFQFGGKRVCALANHNNEAGDAQLTLLIQIGDVGWLVCDGDAPEFRFLLEMAAAQIKAICVSLEAEVATTEVMRAPLKLNHARERRGKLPLYDYHVVSLARRHRVAPRLRGPDEEPGTKKRLHFRRRHLRHYRHHEVWINWMLVGDPDLGWIEKEYRL